jgi:hypothetical protein
LINLFLFNIVFLKDVSSAALKDLIQFMYCGKVNVELEALPAFINIAQALQIEGLTEWNEETTSTASNIVPKDVVTMPQPAKSPRKRIVTSRPLQQLLQQSFKLDSEGSSDDKQTNSQTVQSQSVKRVVPRQVVAAAPKRIKVQQTSIQETLVPLDSTETETIAPQELKTSDTTEFVDMPIESSQMSTKAEPEYTDDLQET